MPRRILWFDSGAGLLAGLGMLLLSAPLAGLYALPRPMLVAMGVANLAYGTYSGLLARRARRPYALVVLLVAANAAWAAFCLLAAARLAGTASAFGLAHLVGEGALVGALAAVEWRVRARLLDAG
ncbi:hypothetical protein [Roseisolibacter sp. H3M3-2]|uniref:hypothetical protein n=1 Tax=Roseisolibacter sp. H3M3-2 TaxID=3031323 RepID=UPI0023DBB8F8|nr:hypothetical protein [Roseisolibacter sp. H3M3-2]MDF1503634.1 hypothetical protein [Roseisolibacter sp. H3M3-2]